MISKTASLRLTRNQRSPAGQLVPFTGDELAIVFDVTVPRYDSGWPVNLANRRISNASNGFAIRVGIRCAGDDLSAMTVCVSNPDERLRHGNECAYLTP